MRWGATVGVLTLFCLHSQFASKQMARNSKKCDKEEKTEKIKLKKVHTVQKKRRACACKPQTAVSVSSVRRSALSLPATPTNKGGTRGDGGRLAG